MRRILAAWLFCCFSIFAAWTADAQFIGEAVWKSVPVGGSLSWHPNSTQPAAQNAGFGSSATFSVTLDATPSASDIIVVGVSTGSAHFGTSTTATLNSAPLTNVSFSLAGDQPHSNAQIFQITGITTSSLSIVVTQGAGGLSDVGVAVGVIKNATSSTATATGNNNQNNQADPQDLSGGTGAITVPSAGVGIFYFGVGVAGTPSSTDSTIVAPSVVNSGGWQMLMGYTTAAGSWNPNISGSPAFSYSNASIAAAAWH